MGKQQTWLRILAMVACIGLALPTLGPGQQSDKPGGKTGGLVTDPDKAFDWLSKGKDFIRIRDLKTMRSALQEWADENGIPRRRGQVTREQFRRFAMWFIAKMELPANSDPVPLPARRVGRAKG
jgi:hypothetical protein